MMLYLFWPDSAIIKHDTHQKDCFSDPHAQFLYNSGFSIPAIIYYSSPLSTQNFWARSYSHSPFRFFFDLIKLPMNMTREGLWLKRSIVRSLLRDNFCSNDFFVSLFLKKSIFLKNHFSWKKSMATRKS